MKYFDYYNGTLYTEKVNLATLANTYGTPCFVYSRAALEYQWQTFNESLAHQPHLICYAVKANSNLGVLKVLAWLGSGFDIVSGGELERVLRVGGSPERIVFSGVGKTVSEIQQALTVGIRCFNVESTSELRRLNQIAGELGKIAPIAVRVNPDVDAKTHPYISTGLKQNKFGIDIQRAITVYAEAAQLPNVQIEGIACHIGSQLTQVQPFVDALQRLMVLVEHLQTMGILLKHIDVGGGLGVRYHDEIPPEPENYIRALQQVLSDKRYTIIVEPGRAIVANAGVLLTKVEYLKRAENKNFAIVDAAMNDLIRPALYQAWHDIIPVQLNPNRATCCYDVVGPICETGDFLGKERNLAIQENDLLAICSAGAYSFVMSSNYNTRPRCPEIMVDGNQAIVVRRRESLDDLLNLEEL
ncbi:MAG: diaminopimelate decarboxylase [Beggiatoa sp. IS2]|nr:MAG: diaminopimelate decarboxylase [Beggiatoa sp. IS2]